MTPNQGQGLPWPLRTRSLWQWRCGAGVRGALERYVECRHMRVRRMQLDSRRIGSISHWRNPLACSVRDNLLRLLPASLGRRNITRIVEPGLALLREPTPGGGVDVKPKMPRAIAVSAAVVLSALALLHVVWTRSPWPLSTRQEFLDAHRIGGRGAPPPLAMTLVVAGLLLAAAWVAACAGRAPAMVAPRVDATLGPARHRQRVAAAWSRWTDRPGLLHLSTRAFEYWDIRLYSPLSLALGAAAVLVGIHPVLLPMYRRQGGERVWRTQAVTECHWWRWRQQARKQASGARRNLLEPHLLHPCSITAKKAVPSSSWYLGAPRYRFGVAV